MVEPDSRTARKLRTARSMLADQLRKLREEKGWSLSELAEKARYDRSDLHKMELGQKLCAEHLIAKLDGLYGTGNTLTLLWQLAREERVSDTYDAYDAFLEAESSALALYQFATCPLPGLLQTEPYARALMSSAPGWDPDVSGPHLALRMQRQERLVGTDPLHYRAVLDEVCFLRVPCDKEIWREQVVHLARMAELWNVTIQVLPFDAGMQRISGGTAALLWLKDGTNVGYQESSHTSALITQSSEVAELRLAYDAMRDAALSPEESLAYIQRALEETTHAHRAENHELA